VCSCSVERFTAALFAADCLKLEVVGPMTEVAYEFGDETLQKKHPRDEDAEKTTKASMKKAAIGDNTDKLDHYRETCSGFFEKAARLRMLSESGEHMLGNILGMQSSVHSNDPSWNGEFTSLSHRLRPLLEELKTLSDDCSFAGELSDLLQTAFEALVEEIESKNVFASTVSNTADETGSDNYNTCLQAMIDAIASYKEAEREAFARGPVVADASLTVYQAQMQYENNPAYQNIKIAP